MQIKKLYLNSLIVIKGTKDKFIKIVIKDTIMPQKPFKFFENQNSIN